jgi:DNA modification methylase
MIAPNENNQYFGLGLSAFDHNLSRPRHRWFEFKEGFSEALVLEAIREGTRCRRKPRILDPFAGSGTTLVTAGRFGLEATGVEVNPFLVFASRAKCTPNGWRQGAFSKRLAMVLQESRAEKASRLEGVSTFTERKGLRNWLFNRSVLRGFTSIDAALRKTGRYRMPLRLALLAALKDCCNAKRDGKCLRYRDNWQSLGLTSADLRATFECRAKIVLEDVCNHSFSSNGLRVLRGDAREMLRQIRTSTYDLVVTSPPYLNSFDYSDVYRPELFVGDFVSSNHELRKIRLKTIRSHVQVSWEPEQKIVSALLHPVLKRIRQKELWDARLPDMVQSYFFDMAQILVELNRILKPGGQSWIVVSSSAYAGVEIPVDLVLADVASSQGWRLRDIHVLRQLRSAGQQWSQLKKRPAKPPLRESLVILERR